MSGGKRPPIVQWGYAATAGSSLVGPVVAGIILDLEFNWTPWATLSGLVLGIFSCMSILMMAARQNNDKRADQSDTNNEKS